MVSTLQLFVRLIQSVRRLQIACLERVLEGRPVQNSTDIFSLKEHAASSDLSAIVQILVSIRTTGDDTRQKQ